ncbi:structural maintenance of chromosomes protein 4-like protein [Sarcoptes scabiei]|uniref:Structural maintenance of chromosomes protein 4 n=1 Tax=Sarcoptes scabiei TaxID=52283 RepID=A0A132A8C7_SARSC|nr:structural maintenance of chromosomes protein 4-like protein [Sarcoptes scabiei]
MPIKRKINQERDDDDHRQSLNRSFRREKHQKSRTSCSANDFEEDFHEDQGTQIIDDIYMPPPPVQPTNLEDQTGKRLIIETIEIINFKSYGGKSIIGPFYKSFNSIVGPNGSGKSNVIDSMLFVFGYRAQKLRSNKISNIIHNSEKLPNCTFAQVIVNFVMIDDRGDEKVNLIEDSRFNISRVYETVKRAKCEAIKALKLENQKKIEESKLIQFNRYRIKKKMASQEAQKKEFDLEVEKLKQIAEELDRNIKNSNKEYSEKNDSYKKVEKTYEEYKEKILEYDKKDYIINSKSKAARDKLKKLNKQIAESQKKLQKLQDEPVKAESIEEFQESIENLQQNLVEIEKLINQATETAQDECSEMIKNRDEINHKLMKFKTDQNDKLSAKNKAYNEYMVRKQRVEDIQAKYDQLQSKIKQINDENQEKTKMITRYEQEIPVEKGKQKDLNRKYEKLECQRSSITKEINQKNDELSALKDFVSKSQSRDQIRNALMEAKQKGILKGIYGRLGDLGAIDKKFDIAISTACGRLKNFVVDTIENAQKCVEFLKENSLPPVTFIALDKIKVQWDDDVQYPENIPRLFDLIRIKDERIRPAFYYALRDTLVAENIDQAKRITKNARYRIVTLKGDLIEMEGAMTGGGKPRSGGMGQSIAETETDTSKEFIADLEKKLKNLLEERQQIDYQIESIREEISQSFKDITFMEDKLQSFRLEVGDSDQRLKQLKENLAKIKSEADQNKDDPQLEKLRIEFEKAESIYEKEMSKGDSLEESIKELDEKIQQKLNKKLDPLKKKRKNIDKDLKENQSKMNQILSEMKAYDLSLKKAEENLSSDEKLKQQISEELEELQREKQECESSAKEIGEKCAEIYEKMQNLEQEIDSIRKSIKENDLKLNDTKNKQLDLNLFEEQELERISPEQIEKKIQKIQADLEKLHPNFASIEEFKKKNVEYKNKLNELREITSKRDVYMEHLKETKHRRFKEFRQGFLLIARKLKELYRTITLGGDADLEFVDSLDPFSEGINFAVRPNKKSWKNNINLSGGEKTLASLALIFALHYYKPSPLYIMDEIDAALDFKNVSIIANYIKKRTKNTQFLIISLRNNMYELADRLIGIYKTHNITGTVVFDWISFDSLLKHRDSERNKNSRGQEILSQENSKNLDSQPNSVIQ